MAAVRAQTPARIRYTWIDARCVDGPLDLAQVGFQRDLFLTGDLPGDDPVDDPGEDEGLLLTFETQLERDGCRTLMLWDAERRADGDGHEYRFRAWPAVVLPAPRVCGVEEHGARAGRITVDGDILTLAVEGSAFCRGFDVFFRFKRTTDRPLSPRDVILRYVAQFNRQDAQAVTELFAPGAVVSEPFSPVSRGSLAEHRGRAAIFSWHADAFASNHWSAMRLVSLDAGEKPGQFRLRWEYMDNLLRRPLQGEYRLQVGERGIERADMTVQDGGEVAR